MTSTRGDERGFAFGIGNGASTSHVHANCERYRARGLLLKIEHPPDEQGRRV